MSDSKRVSNDLAFVFASFVIELFLIVVVLALCETVFKDEVKALGWKNLFWTVPLVFLYLGKVFLMDRYVVRRDRYSRYSEG